MLRRMCRGKIHRATVTHSRLDYEGSIEIDPALLDAAGMLPNEVVLVANVETGVRFETYVIEGKRDSGVIGLNGAAARLGNPGDLLIIMSFAYLAEDEARRMAPKFVLVDAENRPKEIRSTVTNDH